MLSKINNIDISVIIPCFNQGRYVAEAVESVNKLNQGHNFVIEILIINDGSTDQLTIDTLAQLNKRGYTVINQINQGLSAARNTGLSLAQGKYIQFLDADDIVVNDKFYRQLLDFEADPELGCSVSDFVFSSEDTEEKFLLKTHQAQFKGSYPLNDFLFRWERGFTVPPHCFLFKREVFISPVTDEALEFDTNLCSREDWLVWCTIALLDIKFKFNNEVMAVYRMHRSSLSKKVMLSIEGYVMAQTKIAGLIEDSQLREKFIQSSAEHLCKEYLFEYKNMIIPNQVIPVCFAKFIRMLKKMGKWFNRKYPKEAKI